MKPKLRKFDVADFLVNEKEIEAYLTEALKYNDAAYTAKALGNIARARGMAKVAKQSGLSRESLYKALCGDGNPQLATFLKVLSALGLSLTAHANGKKA